MTDGRPSTVSSSIIVVHRASTSDLTATVHCCQSIAILKPQFFQPCGDAAGLQVCKFHPTESCVQIKTRIRMSHWLIRHSVPRRGDGRERAPQTGRRVLRLVRQYYRRQPDEWTPTEDSGEFTDAYYLLPNRSLCQSRDSRGCSVGIALGYRG